MTKPMKISYLVIALTVIVSAAIAQKPGQKYNNQKGAMAAGYDVVSYFSGSPTKGSKQFTHKLNGVEFRFTTEQNKSTFIKNPEKYIPAYGGWCAYAIAKDNSKVKINPKSYLIQKGKLLLFYNKLGINTLEKWKKEGETKLLQAAEKNWNNSDQ